jgi:hypothetical protein
MIYHVRYALRMIWDLMVNCWFCQVPFAHVWDLYRTLRRVGYL